MTKYSNEAECSKEYGTLFWDTLWDSINCVRESEDELIVIRDDFCELPFPKAPIKHYTHMSSRAQEKISDLIVQLKKELERYEKIDTDIGKQLKTKESQ